jgi:phospholipase/carboxylesterase
MPPTPASLSLTHLFHPPRQASDSPPPLLILLHGYGSNERDLVGLAPYLDPRFQIVSARAPHALEYGSYAWFELSWTAANDIIINFQQAEQSRALLIGFLAEVLAAYGGDPAQVYLLGFSQGAIMSASVTLTAPELIAGTVLMSGRIPEQIRPQIAPAERLVGKPFLVVHGVDDTVLPIQNGRASRAILATLPVALTYHEYPMAHEINAQSLADVTAWLTKRLDGDLRVQS